MAPEQVTIEVHLITNPEAEIKSICASLSDSVLAGMCYNQVYLDAFYNPGPEVAHRLFQWFSPNTMRSILPMS